MWSARSPPGRTPPVKPPTPAERDALRDELAALVLTQKATFATPVWLNAGLTERPLTSACFILKAEDSIPELLDWNTREGLIFQQGGGAGINLSAIRSSSEPVSRGGLASGPVSFMRATDAWAATIRAGGRARRGAKMVVLDASHPDILEFIDAKAREEDRGRALLAAGYPLQEVVASLAFQHANHSVRVTDEFMRLAVDGGEWALRAVTTGEVLETLPARRLLCACAEAACRCGDPGLMFADQIARWHTCPNTGPITASNPCGEFLHVADSACNLATLNLLAFLKDREFDIEGFTSAVELLVLAQDAIVDGSGYPSQRDRAQRPPPAPDRDRLRQPRRPAALARNSLRLRRRTRLGRGDHRPDDRRGLSPLRRARSHARTVRRVRAKPRTDAARDRTATRKRSIASAASSPQACCAPRAANGHRHWSSVTSTVSATRRRRSSRRPARSA